MARAELDFAVFKTELKSLKDSHLSFLEISNPTGQGLFPKLASLVALGRRCDAKHWQRQNWTHLPQELRKLYQEMEHPTAGKQIQSAQLLFRNVFLSIVPV